MNFTFTLPKRKSAAPRAVTHAGAHLRPVASIDPAGPAQAWQRLDNLPRPPAALPRLVSPEVMARASSSELAALVMGEPVVAAQVMCAVNSPMYGLGRPVLQLGQAVTFLGLNTVRSIALRYLMDTSFQSRSPAVQRRIDCLWGAGLLAGDMASRVAQALRLPDPAGVSTHVVLSFVGHLAAATLMPPDALDSFHMPLPEQAALQRELIGLPGAELGHRLLLQWGLPTPLVDAIAAMDAVLTQAPDPAQRSVQQATSAVGFLCARLSERLMRGQVALPLQFDATWLAHEDFTQLPRYLRLPELARLPEVLGAADLNAALERRLDALGASPCREAA